MDNGSARTRINVSNVLVIGSGAAGLRAAIAADEAGTEVVVIGKRQRKDAHTVLAAGGINAALGTRDPEDSWQQHFADTLKEGYYLSDPRVVEIMAKEAPRAINELVEWGCPLARTENGELDQRFFGAHKYRRTCYAGDYTGRVLLYTLADKVEELGIPVIEGQYVSKLLVYEGRCFGALAFDIESGERTVHLADAVVLAAGGHTRLWRRSSSRRDENTGDGMFLALEAGCRLSDMELVQFHPTGMVHPEDWAGTLVTEAVRGEGGRLYNANGERYMERYDPERRELSTRDRVALANYTEIAEGRGTEHGGVYLDISHRDKDYILEKLPRMYRQYLDALMLDISSEPMEVAPTSHYSMGGILVEPETHATDVEGLYAAGETTAGLHGANRLGGNSLSETLIFGRRSGDAAAAFSLSSDMQLRSRAAIKEAIDELSSFIHEGDEFARPLQRAVRDTMWENCGVVRDEERLEKGLKKLAEVREAARNVDVRPSSEGYADLAHALDLRASLVTAEASLLGAVERKESRGAHSRSDYPETDPNLKMNFVITRSEDGGLTVSPQAVEVVPDELQEWLDEKEIQTSGRLLE
ncbi:MAG TPA: FAD-dependent oxidoreductase [Rubrobacteraceae bacterium]|nr:FAD-dependent oxidoreductase [Rubrobacteraceae bacterium]